MKSFIKQTDNPPRTIEIGKVMIHAVTMPFAIPHLTAEKRVALPAPITAEVIT